MRSGRNGPREEETRVVHRAEQLPVLVRAGAARWRVACGSIQKRPDSFLAHPREPGRCNEIDLAGRVRSKRRAHSANTKIPSAASPSPSKPMRVRSATRDVSRDRSDIRRQRMGSDQLNFAAWRRDGLQSAPDRLLEDDEAKLTPGRQRHCRVAVPGERTGETSASWHQSASPPCMIRGEEGAGLRHQHAQCVQ